MLKSVCDSSELLLAKYREQYPGVDTTSDARDVFSCEAVDGVVIATPAETHFSLARAALLAGKHVYVEKPLVLQEDQAEELISFSEKRGLTLMVGHLLRYHPAFVCLQELVSSGELGRINYIYSHRLNFGKIRREENILWSFAPHDISMILSLAGEYPESIRAMGGNYLHSRIADVTTTHLEFASGLRAHIFVSWLHPFKVQQLVVVGDRKMAVFDDTLGWSDKLLLYPHKINWQNCLPVPAKGERERVNIAEAEPLRLECEHFVSCIRNRCSPVTDGPEGLRVLKILNASQHSLDLHGAKISLPEVDRGLSHDPAAEHTVPVVPVPVVSSQPFFAHDTAVLEDDVEIGNGTKIWHFSHVLPGTRIGERCNIGQNVVIGPDGRVGNGCKIQNNVSVYKGVTLEDDVFCGPSMVFTNVFNPRAHIRRMDELRPTLVKKGATLGANCTIVCGVTIGRYAFVGAGAVVTRDVPDHALVTGNPARRQGWMSHSGHVLVEADGNGYMHCPESGARYKEIKPGILQCVDHDEQEALSGTMEKKAT